MSDDFPRIDPNALYTVDQAARLLMQVNDSLSYEQAYQKICAEIDSGKLPIAGYLAPAVKRNQR